MSDLTVTNLDDLLAEAERRAGSLRASGELPADIDQRLADDYTRTVRRSVDRSEIDPRPAIENMRSSPAISMSRVDVVGTKPGAKAVKRIAGRFVAAQMEGLASQTEEMRTAMISVLSDIAAELDRQRRLTDNAVATADMLASRVTSLERKLARRSSSTGEHDDHPA